MKRIPTLDGWRGIAIVMVLLDHYAGQFFAGGVPTGLHGVDIFFVLSGYLITSNLISSPIDLKKFYIRRFFRLMPAAWIYLVVLLMLGDLMHLRLTSWDDLRACALFYRNYAMTSGSGLTVHFWSLSIEEQFYLVWPGLLLLVGLRRARWVAGIGALGVAIFRFYNWQHYWTLPTDFRTEVHADALLIGCLLALYLSDATIRRHAERFSKWLALPAFAGLVFAIMRYSTLAPLWEAVCIAILITATMLHPDWAPSRLLSWKPLAWLGTVSYSIYIWQMLFMWLGDSPEMLALVGGVFLPMCALGSYYLIEQPCTRFGRRLTAPKEIPVTVGELEPAVSS